MKITPKMFLAAKAVARAKSYYGKNFGGYEVWESSAADSLTIRAWNNDNSDYGFWTEEN